MEQIKKKIAKELAKLEELNSEFNVAGIELDEEWEMNLEDPDWTGRINYGNLSNYLLFLEVKEDGIYLLIVCESEPTMATNDWLFGKGYQSSDCHYEFNCSSFDVAADYSYDNAKPVFEVKVSDTNTRRLQQAIYDYAEGFQDPDPETARLLDLLGASLTEEDTESKTELAAFFKAMEE